MNHLWANETVNRLIRSIVIVVEWPIICLRMMILFFILLVSLLSLAPSNAQSQKALSKSTGPPAFFLQDPTDGLCLAGDKYKRCAIDTLWYVSGKPGSYQIHHRLVDEDDLDLCLGKSQCHLDASDVQLGSCSHCGAKKWNILGDAETGLCVFLLLLLDE